MTPIVPAGGKRIDWIEDPELIKKTAQMFDDDPQLEAIKDLPGMKDQVSDFMGECPPCDAVTEVSETNENTEKGGVADAIEKVKDAAEEVAEAASKEVAEKVNDALNGEKDSVEYLEFVKSTFKKAGI